MFIQDRTGSGRPLTNCFHHLCSELDAFLLSQNRPLHVANYHNVRTTDCLAAYEMVEMIRKTDASFRCRFPDWEAQRGVRRPHSTHHSMINLTLDECRTVRLAPLGTDRKLLSSRALPDVVLSARNRTCLQYIIVALFSAFTKRLQCFSLSATSDYGNLCRRSTCFPRKERLHCRMPTDATGPRSLLLQYVAYLITKHMVVPPTAAVASGRRFHIYSLQCV